MSLGRCILLWSAALVCAGSVAPQALAAHPDTASTCFRPGDFASWKAPDAKTLYIRVFPDRFFRLDLAGSCPTLLFPDAHLVTRFDSTNLVCRAIDWDIEVRYGLAGPQRCIVKSMRVLSRSAAARLPKRARP